MRGHSHEKEWAKDQQSKIQRGHTGGTDRAITESQLTGSQSLDSVRFVSILVPTTSLPKTQARESNHTGIHCTLLHCLTAGVCPTSVLLHMLFPRETNDAFHPQGGAPVPRPGPSVLEAQHSSLPHPSSSNHSALCVPSPTLLLVIRTIQLSG